MNVIRDSRIQNPGYRTTKDFPVRCDFERQNTSLLRRLGLSSSLRRRTNFLWTAGVSGNIRAF